MNISSFPAHPLLAKILLLPLVYLVLQFICQNISVDTSRFTNWWSDFSLLLSPFKTWYLNFGCLLWLQKDSTSCNTFLCLDWSRLISKDEVAHAKYHSCKCKKKGEGGEKKPRIYCWLKKNLITANILAGKLISQNIYANKRSSSTTRASVI